MTPKVSEQDLFIQSSVERHRAFVDREAAAKDDRERLEIFAEFVVAESRLRRDRYSAAFDSMAGDIFDLTRDLWRSYGSGRRSATPVTTPAAASDGAKLTRTMTASSDAPIRAGGYKPCLSPIPSMAMSTVPDEEDSRGRTQSRWWEASIEGGSQGRGGRKIERSKRESKYMGVPVEHLIQLENDGPGTPHDSGSTPSAFGSTPGPGSSGQGPPTYYGPNEYPPEKTGLHDAQQQLTPKYPYWNHSAPATPDPYKLDVSRLVTLPPPYPRHHPAVNNNHPDLAPIRNTHRSCADLAQVEEVKSLFSEKLSQIREQHRMDATARRERMRADIQSRVQSGSMGYAAAAQAESSFEADEPKRMRDGLKMEYDAYCAEVMSPLHALLSERITKSTAAIDHLRSALDASRHSNPNQAQEEGDERPELLEKLTLLKWLSEARETAHRELFSLESERNEMYKALVVLPYRAAGQEDKAVDAEQFFEHDEKERRGNLEKENLKRVEQLMDVVEENVTRGVEDLLGAFWDIAPGLLGVVQKIPLDLRRERPDLLIPPMEFDENPSYIDHPLQYLYTLLAHAEKSAYQFIESQTNLLCLLHEVKSSVMVAGSKVMESERVAAGEGEHSVREEMEEVRRMEEERLTADLKDKVRIVDGQWKEGLGDALHGCRQRVERYLVQSGGWDEGLQE
ncbi:hypothetical protein NA57DRAFT_31255 [Rhizodiscina lignyota]|uniref:Uncharacterized protein n=1 Tax=Rhizodiscina lignyota TaxID=1504668 RepID=A0A9P4IR35_9PEZI|nr:hypothetical protein NA57DRAFT_31255 [Rhizodiscina lignyota]